MGWGGVCGCWCWEDSGIRHPPKAIWCVCGGLMLRPEKCYLIVLAQTPSNVKEQDRDGFRDFADPRNVSPGLTYG